MFPRVPKSLWPSRRARPLRFLTCFALLHLLLQLSYKLSYKLQCFGILYLCSTAFLFAEHQLIPTEFFCNLLHQFFHYHQMPSPTHWYCGHCSHGPMKIAIDAHCVNCYRQKDSYATYEALTTSSTSAGATALLPPTAYPNAPDSENLPLDSSKLKCSSTTVEYQGETSSNSIPGYERPPTGYLSDSIGLGRGQIICCSQPAQEGWFCCQCRPPYNLILLFEANAWKVATAPKTQAQRSNVSFANTPNAEIVLELLENQPLPYTDLKRYLITIWNKKIRKNHWLTRIGQGSNHCACALNIDVLSTTVPGVLSNYASYSVIFYGFNLEYWCFRC